METVTSRQSEIQKFIADGCKEALLEEKRRFCFLVDKHCSFANHIHYYHRQVSVQQTALSVAVILYPKALEIPLLTDKHSIEQWAFTEIQVE